MNAVRIVMIGKANKVGVFNWIHIAQPLRSTSALIIELHTHYTILTTLQWTPFDLLWSEKQIKQAYSIGYISLGLCANNWAPYTLYYTNDPSMAIGAVLKFRTLIGFWRWRPWTLFEKSLQIPLSAIASSVSNPHLCRLNSSALPF